MTGRERPEIVRGLLADDRYCSDVDRGPNVEPFRASGLPHRRGAPDRPGGSVEAGEQAVPGAINNGSWLLHHCPPAIARISFDQRQPGYWTTLATTSSPSRPDPPRRQGGALTHLGFGGSSGRGQASP